LANLKNDNVTLFECVPFSAIIALHVLETKAQNIIKQLRSSALVLT